MKVTNCTLRCKITPANEPRPENSLAVMFADAPLTFPNDNPVVEYLQNKALIVADDITSKWKWEHVTGIEKAVITQALINNNAPHWKWYWCTIEVIMTTI